MEKVKIKSLLLNHNFIDNEYLTKYINLCYYNLNTKKEKFKTQYHHILPVSYYKQLYNCKTYNEAKKFADLDQNNILVHLKHKDHILAHFYLTQCCPDFLLYSLYSSLYRMINIKDNNITYCVNKYLSLDEIKVNTDYLLANIDLNIYQKNYEKYLEMNSKLNSERRKGKPTHKKGEWHPSAEAIEKNRQAHLGKRYHIKTPRSIETRKKLSESLKGKNLGKAKGKIYIRKDNVVKRIDPAVLQSFINDGWEKGKNPIAPEVVAKRKKHIYTQEERQSISLRNKGRKRTPEQIKQNSDSHKGKIPWNKNKKGEGNSCYGKYPITDGIIVKFWKDEYGPLPEGFIKGNNRKGKATIQKGTRKWYTDRNIDILAEKCPEGFVLGRSKYNRKTIK